MLHLGENGLEKYRLAKKWEQFKIFILVMDHPVFIYCTYLPRTYTHMNINTSSATARSVIRGVTTYEYIYRGGRRDRWNAVLADGPAPFTIP